MSICTKLEAAVRQFTNIPTTQADAFIRNAHEAFKRAGGELNDETFTRFVITIDHAGRWMMSVHTAEFEWVDMIDPLEIKVMR